MAICSNCSNEGTGDYCSACGLAYIVKRITVVSILHEVAHIFTHFEKGFGYTFKQLAIRPGRMQKDYLAGDRKKHQKPFSMFFVCATLAGLAIYWSIKPSTQTTPIGVATEEFSRHYFVILQSIFLPFYTLLTWLLFRSKNFNYAEALVLFVYSLAFVLILMIPVNMINLIPHHFETTFAELPVMGGYIIWTNLKFFNTQPRWLVILKSLLVLFICLEASNIMANQIIHWMLR
jgi:Protein of unknown function (DUF3667)